MLLLYTFIMRYFLFSAKCVSLSNDVAVSYWLVHSCWHSKIKYTRTIIIYALQRVETLKLRLFLPYNHKLCKVWHHRLYTQVNILYLNLHPNSVHTTFAEAWYIIEEVNCRMFFRHLFMVANYNVLITGELLLLLTR